MNASIRSGELAVTIVAPVYRDWESASLLARALDEALLRMPAVEARILFVDDGSPDGLAGWEPFEPRTLRAVEVLRLRRNLGHQKAIACGLCVIEASRPCDAVVVMDADGEDRPEDVVRLLERFTEGGPHVVFGSRRKRLESRVFRTGYTAYRLMHRVLTGVPVRMGNFSVLPFRVLRRLTCMSELWNHYVGAVFKSKLPFEGLPTDRGRRYRGQSRMDLIALVNHGLAGIATFHDVAATRILIGSMLGMALVVAAFATVIGVRLTTSLAVPGWATYTAGLLIVLFAQMLAISFSLVFTLTSSRTNALVVPARDHALFVEGIEPLLSPRGGGTGPA